MKLWMIELIQKLSSDFDEPLSIVTESKHQVYMWLDKNGLKARFNLALLHLEEYKKNKVILTRFYRTGAKAMIMSKVRVGHQIINYSKFYNNAGKSISAENYYFDDGSQK
jgi:hypothetical protein